MLDSRISEILNIDFKEKLKSRCPFKISLETYKFSDLLFEMKAKLQSEKNSPK